MPKEIQEALVQSKPLKILNFLGFSTKSHVPTPSMPLHWDSLQSPHTVRAPFLEVFKARLDEAWSNLA